MSFLRFTIFSRWAIYVQEAVDKQYQYTDDTIVLLDDEVIDEAQADAQIHLARARLDLLEPLLAVLMHEAFTSIGPFLAYRTFWFSRMLYGAAVLPAAVWFCSETWYHRR